MHVPNELVLSCSEIVVCCEARFACLEHQDLPIREGGSARLDILARVTLERREEDVCVCFFF